MKNAKADDMSSFELRSEGGRKRKAQEEAPKEKSKKPRERKKFSGRSEKKLFKNSNGFHIFYSELSEKVPFHCIEDPIMLNPLTLLPY